MATVASLPSNKRQKTILPPPCFYNDLHSSYRVEWEARKRKFPPSIAVSSLCFVEPSSSSSSSDDSDGKKGSSFLLVGMTKGSLTVFQHFGQQSESEEEVLQQQVARGEANDQDDESSSDITEPSGWKLVVSHELCKGALTFLHVSKLSEKQSVVLAGGMDGLWCWNSVSDLLTVDRRTVEETKTMKPANRLSKTPKNQSTYHHESISIEKAQASDSDVYISTPHRKLYQIGISSLIASSANGTTVEKKELPLPDRDDGQDKSDIVPLQELSQTVGHVGDFEITALHVTGTSLLVGTNQSKVHCWDIEKQAYSEPLDLSSFNNSKLEEETAVRVTAISSIQSDWWTIAGSIISDETWTGSFRKKKAGYKRPVSFLGTWHGPSKSRAQLVSNILESIQGLLVAASGQLYSIGNVPTLTVFESPYQLERPRRIGTNAKSNKAICCGLMNGGLAVAGVGSKVDLVQSSVRLQSLDLLQAFASDPQGAGARKN
ncbi:unnamed protein product [Cylindrotheca closterium]|uniref:Uncharacterized protein n=1 Tax=Cylindrotheca closterium TaxID=2856 RepID=A0AAD2G2A6_9STRA|nr:unnamed protein product [Cylindrotheca closterium]